MTEREFYDKIPAIYEDLMKVGDRHGIILLSEWLFLLDPIDRHSTSMVMKPKPNK